MTIMPKKAAAVEAKTAAVVAEVKPAVAEVKSTVKKAVKKAASKVEKAEKKAEKKAAKKTAAPKAAKVKTHVVLEFQGRQMVEAELVEKAKKLWADAGKTEAVKELNLYVKPEDGAVYCVINGETMGSFEL